MQTLTIHILVTNNIPLDDCILSLQPLGASVLIGDFGSSVNKQGIIHLPYEKDYSKSRNDLIGSTSTDWQLWIEPWERIISGHEQILWAMTQTEDAFNIYNVQNELLQKQTRLWRTGKRHFVHPVYECLEPDTNNKIINCVITGSPPNRHEETINILANWRKSCPHNADVEYYTACAHLSEGKYDEFLKHAEHFFFRTSKTSTATLLTHYYYALVQMVKNNPEECIRHIVLCLAQQPTMAEFWCLLGDAFYKMKQYHRATAFYDNAMVFGTRRLQDDPYPIEIAKYKDYPEKMLALCREIIKMVHSSH